MKKTFLTLSLLTVTTAMMAVPAKRGMWQTITTADGTEVRVEMAGDEHLHWLQAADGTCYVMNDGTYVQVDRQLLAERHDTRLQARQDRRRAVMASTSDGLGKYGTMSRGACPSIGEYTIPVVMVQFSDTKFKSTTTVEKMTRYYNDEGYSEDAGSIGSVRDYFVAQSGGQFVPTFDVVGIVTLANNHAYYGTNDRDGNDQHLDELPGDVTAAAVEQLGTDFSKYVVPAGDSNHKAGVPLLCMLYAGKGEATESESTANQKLLWPCEWDGTEDLAFGDYQGVHFNSFFIGNELNTGGTTLMGPSVFIHEFGHALGLPDFYVTDYSYSGDNAFGHWSIMDTGAYVDDYCRKPIGYNAYEKSYMGWLDLKELDTDAEAVTLASPDGLAEGSAVIVRNSTTETFILENRQPGTWYPTAFGSGILATRIAYSQTVWNYNTVNNTQARKRACVLTANGAKMYYSADKNNLYGYTKTAISTLKTYNGSTKTIGVKNITKNDDGTITLTLNEGSQPDEPQPTTDGALFYESFDQCNGAGGNDDQWSNINGTPSIVADNDGWLAASDKGFAAAQCARFGTRDVSGLARTPAIALDGEAVLTFKAGAWDGAKDGTTLRLDTDGGTVDTESVTMTKGAFTDYSVKVSATGTLTIIFATDKGRFFLDEVTVKGVETAISELPRPRRTDGACYSLSGQRVVNPAHGLYIVNGKKVVR